MPGRRRHTVVLSDVHLSQTHPRDDADPLWMRYRWSDYHPDADFEAFVESLLEACDDSDTIELVFNGDLLDFDAPVVEGLESTSQEYPLDDAGCTAQVERIIRDHPRFFRAIAALLARGHRVLFVSGNHDVELYWPGVRRALRTALRDAAAELDPPSVLTDLEERVRFRTWFHLTEDGIYIEHGSQYDTFNTMPDPMTPLVEDASSIHPICGKLAFKRTGARMGYFNPYCEDTFYMGLFGYLRHFFVDYLLSRRHIVRHWAFGALSTTLEIVKQNPFATVDTTGVGALMKIAIEKSRKTRPDIKLGICGEHGGEPASVKFCHDIGLTYVSCSPFRVPIARLAAAQAALADES